GDIIKVEVLEVDPKTGKISLDRLDKPEAPEGSAPRREDRGPRPERSDRDNRPGRSNRSSSERTPRRRHDS
ncbi:MAG: hypothetical protein RR747_06430, partial [Gordonibacter sp.]